jgi:hypothetical protein
MDNREELLRRFDEIKNSVRETISDIEALESPRPDKLANALRRQLREMEMQVCQRASTRLE